VAQARTTKESLMIPYRPIAPLTLGASNGWRSVLAAVVMAALLGTTLPESAATPVAAEATGS
jgi:hypothetical protein